MSHCYKYALAQMVAHPSRGERLNVGLIIFADDGLDVRLPRSLDKLKAISAALDLEAVRGSIMGLTELDEFVRAQGEVQPEVRLHQLNELAPLCLSHMGEFVAYSSHEYEAIAADIMRKLVEPEPAPPKKVKKRHTKLLSDVKLAFKSERVMARKGEGLETHRIVSNHEIVMGLSADLLLKNGAMHVIETVDASSSDMSVKKVISDVAVAALVFEQARMHFGESGTRSNLVYQASSATETMAMPALLAAEHQGAELINWESHDDRLRFISHLSSLAVPVETKKARVLLVHASSQHKFDLN